MTGGVESATVAGEVEEKFRTTVRTANPGKPAAWVAAVEIALDHLFDDGSEEAVPLIETMLIFGQELVEVTKQHPKEDSLLGLARAVDSRYIGKKEARSGLESGGCRKVQREKELKKISFRLSPDGVNRR
jgi:hypothetical protein